VVLSLWIRGTSLKGSMVVFAFDMSWRWLMVEGCGREKSDWASAVMGDGW
jgi:hypothetical protein